MSAIQYGGDDANDPNCVILDICRINSWQQELARDPSGLDYLWTVHTVDATCVFNPTATRVASGGGNDSGPVTAKKVKTILLAPQKFLRVTLGGTEVLSSPLIFDDPQGSSIPLHDPAIDCTVGPLPLYCNVEAVHGSKSLIVRFVIRTWVNEFTPVNSALQSHRWNETDYIDELHYTTRVMDGTAIFRKDYVLAEALRPDDMRAVFNHPVPKNFQRQSVRITSIEQEGTMISYEIIDQETPVNLNGMPFVKVAGQYNHTYTRGDNFRIQGPGKTTASGWAGIAQGGLQFLANNAAAYINTIGRKDSIQLEAWGNRLASNHDILKKLASIAANYLGDPGTHYALLGTLSWGFDIANRHAWFSYSRSLSGALGGLNDDIETIQGKTKLDATHFYQPFVDGDGKANPLPPGKLPNADNTVGIRGTYLGAVVLQGLQNSPSAKPKAIPALVNPTFSRPGA